MQARMKNPVFVVPEAMKALHALGAAAKANELPETIVYLAHLRASQINGCSVCVEMHANELRQAGETDKRIFAVAAWRDAPYYDESERAALALTEAVTRLDDRGDPVPDDVWDEAVRHFDEAALAALILQIALINFWNRLNVPTRQIAGQWNA